MTKSARPNFFSEFSRLIDKMPLTEEQKRDILRTLLKFKDQKANIMITGATGSGKSSTINALFETGVAQVGCTPNPETMTIDCYDLDGLILWDTPGLGDGKEADERHSRMIIDKLNEVKAQGEMLIDAVLVILDGTSRDFGTSYTLINDVVIPNLHDKERIIVAINQADAAMKGRHWDSQANKPEPPLEDYLQKQAATVSRRIKESTGVDITPVSYSAGYKEEGAEQTPPYNLDKLLCLILEKLPAGKRLNMAGSINAEEMKMSTNDGKHNYKARARGFFQEAGATIGEEIGRVIGGETGRSVGRKIGKFVGSLIDGLVSLF